MLRQCKWFTSGILASATAMYGAGCSEPGELANDDLIETSTPVDLDQIGPNGFTARELLDVLPRTIQYSTASERSGFGAGSEDLDDLVPFAATLATSEGAAEIFRTETSNASSEILRVRVDTTVSSTDGTLSVIGGIFVAAAALDPQSIVFMEHAPLYGDIPSWATTAAHQGIADCRCANGSTDYLDEHGTVGIILDGALVQPRLSLGLDWDDETVSRSDCRLAREFISSFVLTSP